MIITSKINMDLLNHNQIPVVHAVQSDSYSRNLEITLTNGGVPFPIPESASVIIKYQKVDGKGGTYDTLPDGTRAWSAQDHILTVALAPQTLSTAGIATLSVSLIDGQTRLSTFQIFLNVRPIAQAQITESENYTYVTEFLTPPSKARTGQYLQVASVDGGGKVTELRAVDLSIDSSGEIVVPETGMCLPLYSEADNGKVLGIVDGNPAWIEATVSGGTNNPEVTTHGIVWDLVNVTSSNPIASVNDGASLVAVLTPADGCTLGDVTITMDGEVVTGAWNADTATVTIASVTGDVVISCAAVQQQAEVLTWVPAQSYPNSTTFEFTEIASPNMYIIAKQTETTGGTLVVDFDTDDASHIGAMFYLFKDGAPYKMVGQSNSGTPCTGNLNDTFSEYDPGYTSWAFANIVAPATYTIPDGCQLMIAARRSSASSANGNFDSNSSFCTWVMDGGMTFKITNDVAASEAGTLSVDDDYAMDYGISTLALVTEGTSATKTGINSAYAAVVEEAKNAWMLEANGDTDKIPLIIHTDQHGSMTKNNKLFPFLAEIVNWYDISKVINLGDTVSNWIDSDADHPWNSCEGLDKYLEAMADVPFSKRIEIFGNHDTWNTSYETAEDQAYLHKYFRNIYARRMDNYGSFVVKDDNYNVKYVVVSGFAYDSKLGGHTHYVVHPDSIRWVISELEKADGYDVILLSHVPFGTDNTTVYNPTDGTSAEKSVGGIAYKKLNELWSGRKAKVSGTVIDEYGASYAFDFTSCDGELLCGLHGHMHEDGYYYIGDLMDVYFDGHLNDNASFFVLVDRANRQLNVWKVTNPDTGATCQNYQIPFDKI